MFNKEVAHGNTKRKPKILHVTWLVSKNDSPTKTPKTMAGLHRIPISNSENARLRIIRNDELLASCLSVNIEHTMKRLPFNKNSII